MEQHSYENGLQQKRRVNKMNSYGLLAEEMRDQ